MYYMNGRRKGVRKKLPTKKQLRKMHARGAFKKKVVAVVKEVVEDVKPQLKEVVVEAVDKAKDIVKEEVTEAVEENLEDLDKDKLIEIAKELGIAAMKNWKKSTIISKIEDARK